MTRDEILIAGRASGKTRIPKDPYAPEEIYKGFEIHCICPPVPTTRYDYHFHIKDQEEWTKFQDFGETVEECKKKIDELLSDYEDCKNCSGVGWIAWSCCGHDITGNDYDNCPSCGEHCVTDEGDDCEECYVTGHNLNQ